MAQTIGERFGRFMEKDFVGRSFETAFFERCLTRLNETVERILNVYGTAGIGKTLLLSRYAAIAERHGALQITVDARYTAPKPESFCREMIGRLAESERAEPERDPGPRTETDAGERCIALLNERAGRQRIVLAFDSYEEMGDLDYWLRTMLLPRLHANILVVVAGRHPLEGPWKHLPAWKRLVVRLPLAELSYEDIREYLGKWGIADEAKVDTIWLKTLGHPLALSLLTPVSAEERPDRPPSSNSLSIDESLEQLLDDWMREVRGEELKTRVYAASTVFTFQQELLGELTEKTVPDDLFEELIGLSFVAASEGGWHIHELVRETIRRSFRKRRPNTFASYEARAMRYYRELEERGLASGESILRPLAELLHRSGNPVLRAHYRQVWETNHFTEPLDEFNREEAKAYVRRRLQMNETRKVRCSDPLSGRMFRFALPSAVDRSRLELLPPLDELCRASPDAVRLLRGRDGRVVGLFAIVPVYARTFGLLAEAKVSRAYFAALPEAEKRRLQAAEAPADTWYVYAMDVEDLGEETYRADSLHAVFERLLSGCLLIESPPPHDYYRLAKLSLGFDVFPGAEHTDYGRDDPSPTYVLDTRQHRLYDYICRLTGEKAAGSGRASPPPMPMPEKHGGLTEREREVAGLLAQGYTNAEIASSLFISEAAVKKHVNSMLSKYGLKNRTQLAAALLEA